MKVIQHGGVPIKMWVDNVSVEDVAKDQLLNTASLPFIHKHIAVMPNVHWGMGSTIGSVIPTIKAIIPAAVGVDIGCGMIAQKLNLNANDLPDNMGAVRTAIEGTTPVGRTENGGPNDKGAWEGIPPDAIADAWRLLFRGWDAIVKNGPQKLHHRSPLAHLGTLGTGNHFIEVCLDESGEVWVMLHSGSRGPGNAIGRAYIQAAKKEMQRWHINLPDKDLTYIVEGSTHYSKYIAAVGWAQEYAKISRELMMARTIYAIEVALRRPLDIQESAVNCHHNYISHEKHFGEHIWITRKGAVSAREGELGIIPGSMGTRSFIVRGKGDHNSFHSCSHGAGRTMSRREARDTFSIEDHEKATEGVECRKDIEVIDETPGAYKNIDDVMASQTDLVDVVHTLKQVVCVKG